jgi:AcrR family transcriptional regulator
MPLASRASRLAPPLRRQPRGLRTRKAILLRAVHLASLEGLEGLTVGRLADDLKMSKSGLFAHFGSKEDLQLATVEAARQFFIDRISRPAMSAPRGMPRLWHLIESWLRHVEGKLFAGGCFFTAASFEFDGRTGPVRDRIVEIMREWMATLDRAVAEAQKAGHIDPHTNATLLAYEVQALGLGAHWSCQLLDDPAAYTRALAVIRLRLASLATPSSPPLPAVRPNHPSNRATKSK